MDVELVFHVFLWIICLFAVVHAGCSSSDLESSAGTCYRVIQLYYPMSITDANNECKAVGANLATLYTTTDASKVWNNLIGGSASNRAYLGATRLRNKQGMIFEWMDGSQVQSPLWGYGEPNNKVGRNSYPDIYCTVIVDGKMKDITCCETISKTTYRVVCETGGSPVDDSHIVSHCFPTATTLPTTTVKTTAVTTTVATTSAAGETTTSTIGSTSMTESKTSKASSTATTKGTHLTSRGPTTSLNAFFNLTAATTNAETTRTTSIKDEDTTAPRSESSTIGGSTKTSTDDTITVTTRTDTSADITVASTTTDREVTSVPTSISDSVTALTVRENKTETPRARKGQRKLKCRCHGCAKRWITTSPNMYRIPKNETDKYRRRFISAHDNRMSSILIGCFVWGILLLLGVLCVLSDYKRIKDAVKNNHHPKRHQMH